MASRVPHSELRSLARTLLGAAGASAAQSAAVAEVLAWSDLVGRPSQGVWRLPILCRRLREGGIRGDALPRFEARAPACGVVHGGSGAGHHVAHVAMEEAIRLARVQGIGCVAALDSNYFGAAAYYVNRAAETGMAGFAFSNSFPKVLACGGARPALGTNPLAFGAPRRAGEPLLIDMATSAAAGSTQRRAPQSLQAGVSVDASGALLPLGGAKGYALGLMVEVLCGVLAGPGLGGSVRSMYAEPAAAGANGQLMIALDVARFMTLETFHERMERLAAWLEASGEPGEVSLPGARRWEARRENARLGVALDGACTRALLDLCAELGVEPTPYLTSSTGRSAICSTLVAVEPTIALPRALMPREPT